MVLKTPPRGLKEPSNHHFLLPDRWQSQQTLTGLWTIIPPSCFYLSPQCRPGWFLSAKAGSIFLDQNFMALSWSNQEIVIWCTWYRFLGYSWMDKELTFWMACHPDRERDCQGELRNGESSQILNISCCIWTIYWVFSCGPHCLINVDNWMQRQTE